MAIQQPETPYLQIIRRTLWLLLAVTLLAGCEKTEERAGLTTTQDEVVLRSTAGSEAAFTVSSTEAWSLTTTGGGFDVSPTRGGRGETTVTVRAQDDNTTTRRKALGSMALRLSSGKAEATVSVVQSPAVAPQTVVMYLPWSGNLYTHFLQNIEDVKKAVAGNILRDSRLVVFLQTSTTKGSLRELYYDNGECRETELRTYENLDVTQAETITGIFDYIKQTAPAERYGITIGSHGMAWIPASGSGRSAADAKAGTEPTATTVPEKWHWEYVSPDGQFTRWFGDGGSRCTNTTTFAEAITAAGIRFEYILFDDCFMSSIEVAYDLRKITRHLIASPCEVMAYGYPYDLVMPYLFTDGGTGYDLDGVCRSFYEFYEQYEAPNYNCGAIAVTVCDQVEQMAEVMRLINNASPAYIPDPEKPLQQYEYLYAPTRFYDLADYVYQLCDDTALLKEFDEQLARTVPERYRLHTGVFLFGRQAADHDLFGHFDQRAEHERDRGEQYPGHRLVQGDALTRRAGSICPAAWRPEDSSRKTAAGRQQPGDSSRETAADGCSWHSGNRYGGNRHGPSPYASAAWVPWFSGRTGIAAIPQECGDIPQPPGYAGIIAVKTEGGSLDRSLLLIVPSYPSGQRPDAGTYSYWPDLSRSTSSRERKRQAPRLRFFLVRPA